MLARATTVVILESRSGAHQVVRAQGLVSDADHLLCRGPAEPREGFARRVKRSVAALAEECSLRRISYVATPGSELASSRQNVLEELVVLLDRGAELELLAPRSMDLIDAVGPLLARAKTGVQVRAAH
jgi:hypothetical protein